VIAPDSGAPRDSRDVRQLEPEGLADHTARLYRAAYGLCGSRADAEDLVQDTFERVLRRPRFLRRDQDLAYLLRVLRNTWISSARGRRAELVPLDEGAEPGTAGDPVVAQVVEAGSVFAALQTLTPPLREAVVAVDVVGLSYREAARALGTREGTIMSRLHRARGQLASQLEPERFQAGME
jgi:RNA polymerase sigma-70 factor, ECF subfamily